MYFNIILYEIDQILNYDLNKSSMEYLKFRLFREKKTYLDYSKI